MEPLADSSNLQHGAGTPLGARKSAAQQTPGGRQRRRSLLPSHGQGTPGTIGRRSENRRQSQALVAEPEREAREPAQDILSSGQVAALYQQCIKLATENKITSKNTWALGLIDHLHDLVRPSGPEGGATNFQKASVTLGAGVEIYAKRVDSVHTEAFKVLGGLSRGGVAAAAAAADPDEPDEAQEGEDGDGGDGEGVPDGGRRARRAAMLRDVNPASTLESSFEALNVRKFDLAFAVDPLFHKTSAQFDEGGARGLLLHNLSVFRGCEILFDSQAQPELPLPGQEPQDAGADCATVDLSGMQAQIGQALGQMQEARLCPAVDELYALLGRAPEAEYEAEAEAIVASVAAALAAEPSGLSSLGPQPLAEDGTASECSAADDHFEDGWADLDAHDDAEDDGGEGEGGDGGGGEAAGGPTWLTQQPHSQEADSQQASFAGDAGPEAEEWQEAAEAAESQAEGGLDAVAWLISRVESLSLDSNKAWAGTSHWRFRSRGEPQPAPASRAKPRKAPASRKGEPLDFTKLLHEPLPEGALAIADEKDIALKPQSRAPTLLPEDVHFKASSLAELFLNPGRPIFEPAARPSGRATSSDAAAAGGGWDAAEGGGGGGGFDSDADDYDGGGGWADADFGDAGDAGAGVLLEAPRKVAQIGINYARRSKQVDVRALKQSLWHIMGEMQDAQQRHGDGELSFQHVISRLGPECEAGSLSDLSVHLCFICVLHLANEHGLRVTGGPSLDRMQVSGLPDSCTL